MSSGSRRAESCHEPGQRVVRVPGRQLPGSAPSELGAGGGVRRRGLRPCARGCPRSSRARRRRRSVAQGITPRPADDDGPRARTPAAAVCRRPRPRGPVLGTPPTSRWHGIWGRLGIVAGGAVFVAALAVPLDDPALVVALMLAQRSARMVLGPPQAEQRGPETSSTPTWV